MHRVEVAALEGFRAVPASEGRMTDIEWSKILDFVGDVYPRDLSLAAYSMLLPVIQSDQADRLDQA